MGGAVAVGAESGTLGDRFGEFFAEVHPGQEAFRWQRRLVDTVARELRWPDAIVAPTGAGKTSVIDAHIFLNAMAGWGLVSARIPRRLILTVDRRALVDSHRLVADAVRERIFDDTLSSPLLRWIRDGLVRRAATAERASSDHHRELPVDDAALVVATVRGGMPRARRDERHAWRMSPTSCAVLCMTPDMFGSRLLFRGYGSSRGARPIDAGLLAYDVVAVVDEAHLNRQLLVTARRVAGLEASAERPLGVPVLQVVETTATPAAVNRLDGSLVVGVEDSDIDAEPVLARRMRTPKPVRLVEVEQSLDGKDAVATVVRECRAMRETQGEGTVGCIVNSVRAALRISAALRDEVGDQTKVVTLVGRLRPFDRAQLAAEHPGIFTPDGNANVGFLVATQTLEVGVDIDLVGTVTELAPASALAQRAGRVNRRGIRASGQIVVVSPPVTKERRLYYPDDLAEALEWIASLPDDGMSALTARFAPPHRLRRTLLQRLEAWDVEQFACTSESLSVEKNDGDGSTGLELWLNDDLDVSLDASLVVRALPADDDLAAQALGLVPVDDAERFPARVDVMRAALKSFFDDIAETHPRAWRIEDGEAVSIRPGQVRPGDTIVVDESAPLFLEGVVDPDGRSVMPDVSGKLEGASRHIWFVARSEQPCYGVAWSEWFDLVTALDQVEKDAGDSVAYMVGWLEGRGLLPDGVDGACAIDYGVAVGDSPSELFFLLTSEPLSDLDEPAREAISPRRKRVLLANHQAAVGQLAGSLAASVGLPADFQRALVRAGEWHDEGKRDLRFQALLDPQRSPGDESFEPLAKGVFSSRANERARRAALGLPVGWRHEQRSAAHAWSMRADEGLDAELVARLVGTTHGHGRSVFADDADRLMNGEGSVDADLWAAAAALFDEGLWETIIDATHHRYGYWGAAYLEALVRLADMTVSAEGR